MTGCELLAPAVLRAGISVLRAVSLCLHCALQSARQLLQTVAQRQLLQCCVPMSWPAMQLCTAGDEAAAAALMVSLAIALQAVPSWSTVNCR